MADWSIYSKSGAGGHGRITDPDKLAAAQEHKISIDIIPNANMPNAQSIYTLEGWMKEPFNYSVAAQYNKIMEIPSFEGFARYGKDLINADAAYHSGFFSKKMFEPGNAYSKLDLKFRIYDDPSVIAKGDLLAQCCLPMIAGNSPMLTTSVISVASNTLGKAVDAAANLTKAAATLNVGNTIAAGIESIKELGTTSKPPHLNVKIGSYFSKTDMVLTSLDFTYSKEFIFNSKTNTSYPAFVDFNISLESLYSMLAMTDTTNENDKRFGTGFEHSGVSRVVVNAAVNENPIAQTVEAFKRGWNGQSTTAAP